MSVWDDQPVAAEKPEPTGVRPTAPHLPVQQAASLPRLHDEVRTAAQKDAAEIVSRARSDIRRIVKEARRELLELSAQVQAANVELPDSALPDPSLIGPSEMASVQNEWLSLPRPALPADAIVPDDDDGATFGLPSAPLADQRSARTFVALFTLLGVAVVAGTFFWMRQPGTLTSPTEVSAPVVAPTEASTAASVPTATPPADSAPPPNPNGVSVTFEATRENWVRVTIDGEADAGRTYMAGEKRVVNGEEEIVLRAGDAGGLTVSVNGRAPVPLGSDGAIVTRRFTRPAPASAVQVLPPPPSVTTPAPAVPLQPVAPAPSPPPTTPPPVATAPTPVTTPSATPAPALNQLPGRVDLAASSRQWIDAYHRQDRVGMAPFNAPSVSISDDRRSDQRFPFGLEVTRTFEDEQLQLSGDTATFTARVTERAAATAMTSRVSQTWVRRLGEWRLQEARLTPSP